MKKESGFKMRSGSKPAFKMMGASPMKMAKKSPMEKGETSFIDKVKSAGKAIAAGAEDNRRTRRGNVISKISRAYKKSKKEYRDEAAAKKSPAKLAALAGAAAKETGKSVVKEGGKAAAKAAAKAATKKAIGGAAKAVGGAALDVGKTLAVDAMTKKQKSYVPPAKMDVKFGN